MWLLDTVTISETIKVATNPGVVRWFRSVAMDDLHTSVLCLGEIERGIVRLPDGKRRRTLEAWMNAALPAWFGSRVHDLDLSATQVWSRMGPAADRHPVDALIAATARSRGFVVVTRNTRDFDGLGVPVLNPWTD